MKRSGLLSWCWRAIRRRWSPCGASQSGASLVEFALFAPVVVMLVAGLIDLSLWMVAILLTNLGASEAARLGLTGYGGAEREALIRTTMVEHVGILAVPDDIRIATVVYDSFSEAGNGEVYVDANDNGRYDQGETFKDVNKNGVWDEFLGAKGPGGADDIVYYDIRHTWHFFTPMIGSFFPPDGSVEIDASIVIQNERF